MAPNIEPKQISNKSPLRKETGSAEIYFAKRLANNEKKIRDKSLKRLHHWLASRQKAENVLSEDEWLKVWKGLFYCMWFSDKPLIQEELAENVSKLIHIFKGTESGILFAKEFFITMGREWMGIDRLRLDKFYMLIKKVYQQLFEFLCESEWDLSLVNRISSFLKGIFIHEQFPVGLKLHLSEYFIPVLKSFVVERSEDVPVDRFLELISPYLLLLARCKSPAVTKVIEEEVLEKLDELAQNDKEGGGCTLKIPYADLAEELTTLAADKLVQTKNRKILHAFINKFQALQKQLQESEEQIPQKTKKAKRKRKPNAELADPKSSDNPVIVESIESSAKAAKKKKQKKEKKTITAVKTQDGSELSDSSPKRDTITSNDVPNENSSTKAALDRSDAEIEKAVNEESSTTDNNTSEQGMGHEFSIHDPLAQKLTFTEEIDDKGVKSKEVASQKSDAGVNTLSELKALRDNTLRLSSNGLSKTNGLTLYVEKKTEKPKTSKNSGKTTATKRSTAGKTVSSPEKKSVGKVAKRKNKLAKKGDESKSSTKTQGSKSTSKSATPKSERRETKCKLHHEANQSMSCPRPLSESQKKKSVTIDMTRNMAVGHRELKISPESPFSPSKRPNKSALKTPPCTHRCKAKDFF